MSKSEAQANESRLVYDYVKLNAHRLPDYWQDKGTHVCIDGVCCMLARDRYTFAEIAEIYECWEHGSGHDETYVDWIAVQFPKLLAAFRTVGAI